MIDKLLLNISIVIIAGTIMSFIAQRLKQPAIPAFIITGIILGPIMHIITDISIIKTLAEIGIAFLLFMVGLELNFKKLKEVGIVSIFGGITFMILLFFTGFISAMLIKFNMIESVYLGILVMFSSTMIVVKILSDMKQLETLHGRIIIGFLLVEDLVAVIVFSLLSNGKTGINHTLQILLLSIGLIILAIFLKKFVFPWIFKKAARSTELLFLLSVSICLLFAGVFAWINSSFVIGAFLAGIILGNLPYNIEIASRIRSLRDFFSLLFFVSLGMEISLINIFSIIPAILIFLFITSFITPVIITLVCMIFGYEKKTSFLTGTSLTQISEFALIIVAQGVQNGRIGQNIFSITIIVAILSITFSTYIMKYNTKLYKHVGKYLHVFERISPRKGHLKNVEKGYSPKTMLIGCDRMGERILKTLKKINKEFIVIDFNPEIIKRLMEKNIPCIYGDIGDAELMSHLDLSKIKLVISTAPSFQDNILLIQKIKHINKDAKIIVTSLTPDDALELYKKGADYVIIPHYLGGEHISIMLENVNQNIDTLIHKKFKHIKYLKNREI